MDEVLTGIDGLIVRSSGAYAKEKLHYLEDYLGIFSVGMKNRWPDRLYYADLFAGPGVCKIRETGEECDGSPLRALKYDFARYFFFEVDPACRNALEARITARFPDKRARVSIIPGDCNEQIGRIDALPSNLGLAFVDPTGVSPIKFETIRKLAAHRRVDLIINFHEGMGIRMNMHQYLPREGTALDEFMGSQHWRERFANEPISLDQVRRLIFDEYRDNLRGLGYQVIDGTQIPVRTQSNTLLYYLVFASKHPKGNEFWQKIQVTDPHGQTNLF